MARVNPEIQHINDPNYLGYSRGITPPEPSRTGAAAVSGIASVLESGAKGVDFIFQDDIQKQIYAQVDSIRNQYTQQLEDVHKNLYGTVNTVSEPMNILPKSAQRPEDLNKMPTVLGNLVAAKESGKISETEYLARLNTYLKSVRSKYPGYREYIDEVASKATGRNVANDYIRSVISDINDVVSADRAERDKILSALLRQENLGYPGHAETYANFLRTGNVSNALRWLNARRQIEAAADDIRHKVSIQKNLDEHTKTVVTREFTDLAHREVANAIETFKINLGGDTPQKIAEFISAVARGEKELSAADAIRLAANLRDTAEATYRSILKQASQPSEGGRSIVNVIGVDEANKIARASLERLNNIADRLSARKLDSAEYLAALNAAYGDDTKRRILTSSIADRLSTLDILQRMSPAYAERYFEATLAKDMPTDVKEFYKETAEGVLTQNDIRLRGTTATITNAIKHMKKFDVRSPRAYKEVLELVNVIVDPAAPDEIKVNVAKAAFSPEAFGLLKEIPPDAVDPNNPNRRIPGKYAVFAMYGRPEIGREIKRLSEKHDPELFTHYRNWMETTFGEELFKRDILDLRNIPERPGVSYGWDETNKRFYMKVGNDYNYLESKDVRGRGESFYIDHEGVRRPIPGAAVLADTKRKLNNINWGLEQMKGLATLTGMDVSVYLIKQLMDAGVDLTKMDERTFPRVILDVLIRAKGRDRLKEDMPK